MPATLFNAITRHQVYLEWYKDHVASTVDPRLITMYSDLRSILRSVQVGKLNELTRKKLTKLLSMIRKIERREHAVFTRRALKELEAFTYIDTDVNRRVFERVEGKPVEQAHREQSGLPLLPLATLLKARRQTGPVWATVSNVPDPAFGLTTRGLFSQYLKYVSRNVRNIIVRGYANGWTVSETVTELFGTRAKRYRDGFMAKAARNGRTTIRTAIQHISNQIQAGVASIFYKNYEWVAVLDSHTSKICRTRDGKVYRYGKGPLPPAHPNCRSSVVPTTARVTMAAPNSFFAWLFAQPALVQNDVLGQRRAGGVRSGRLKSGDIGRFKPRKRLTLKGFVAKFNLITMT